LDTGGSFSTIDEPSAISQSTSVTGINNAGQIVGTYTDANGEHGFLGTPTTSLTGITIQTSPPVLQFSLDGVEYTTTQTQPLSQGPHIVAVTAT
jgi:probable HAF family extracellular repeat protein